MFRDGLLFNIVVLLAPIPGLPGEENSYTTDILRKEVDPSRSQIVGLDRNVGEISRLLDPGFQVRLILLDGSNLDLRMLRKRQLSSRCQIQFFRQRRSHWLDSKLGEKISPKKTVQGFFPVRKRILDH